MQSTQITVIAWVDALVWLVDSLTASPSVRLLRSSTPLDSSDDDSSINESAESYGGSHGSEEVAPEAPSTMVIQQPVSLNAGSSSII